MTLISIIIPFFNTERFFDQCLKSIKNQTFADFEVICVDDGSSDGSLMIAETYSKSDERFKVISIEKQNAGVARNIGLMHAVGKYVIFLDSDDFFEPCMLEKLHDTMIEDDTDFCIFGVDVFDDVLGQFKKEYGINTELCYNSRVVDVKKNIDRVRSINRSVPWDKFYKREFIKENDIWFQSIDVCNDVYFSIAALFSANKVSMIDDVFVHHRKGHGGNLQSKKFKIPYANAQVGLYLMNSIDRLCSDQDAHFAFIDFVIAVINNNFTYLESSDLQKGLRDYLQKEFELDDRLIMALLKELNAINQHQLTLENAVVIYKQTSRFFQWDLNLEYNDEFLEAYRNSKITIRNMYKTLLLNIGLSDPEVTIGVYGTGKHTEGLLSAYNELIGEIKAKLLFIDTKREGYFHGISVIKSENIRLYSFDAIVVSSFVYRKDFILNSKENNESIRIIDFYDNRSQNDLFVNWINYFGE